ncbi:MAG TPA: LL-diaminopimelate aminotransferase, partial [Thermodesulfovibrionia bacterium]|nr:LL-diaminopimelate aminotransferase [Thermodesulfovibrionia bacterium]
KANKPLATFYLWATVPDRQRSVDFVGRLLKDAGILTTPGNGFGQHGEGYVRFTFTQPVERLKEALDRLKRVL